MHDPRSILLQQGEIEHIGLLCVEMKQLAVVLLEQILPKVKIEIAVASGTLSADHFVLPVVLHEREVSLELLDALVQVVIGRGAVRTSFAFASIEFADAGHFFHRLCGTASDRHEELGRLGGRVHKVKL